MTDQKTDNGFLNPRVVSDSGNWMTFTAGRGKHCEESHEELDGLLQNLIYTLTPPIKKICYVISDCQTLATSIVLDS